MYFVSLLVHDYLEIWDFFFYDKEFKVSSPGKWN